MSLFRTIIPAKKYPFNLNYKSKILFLGSCFSDHISQKLTHSGFSITANPFGVLYNPISIKNAFNILLDNKIFTENDLVEHQGLYHSFSHHSSFSGISKEQTLTKINDTITSQTKLLKEANLIFITFGTAYVYRYKKNNAIVSNCHKLPSQEFEHFSLTVDNIVAEYKILLSKLKTIIPHLNIVFTVSPIRHWKDGAHENQLSKSVLHLAIAKLQDEFNFVHYYPSYELVMDDLRDYRFYTEDMMHLNSQAIDYIYQHFRESFFSDNTQIIEKQVVKLKRALNHRAFNPDTKEHKAFLKSTKQKIEQLLLKYPEINI